MKTRLSFVAMALAALLFDCQSQYRPLAVAEECSCKPSEYCKVSPTGGGSATCAPLPQACGGRPTCDCVGEKTDACRDEDGRLTVIPQRAVPDCAACASGELCLERAESERFCRVLPPQCEETPTCDCVLDHRGASAKLRCVEDHGRIVATLVPN